jgi:large subunit ribosomal protein L6
MSRLGREPLPLPAGVTATISAAEVTVKGPKGEVGLGLPAGITVKEEDGKLVVERKSDSKHDRSCHGMVRRILENHVTGVRTPFTKTLDIVGVGYQTSLRGKQLGLKVGYANEIVLDIIEGLEIVTPSATRIVVSGCDKQKVGEMGARIRRVRPPEPYNGKGIRYVDERIVRKAGKSFASAG